MQQAKIQHILVILGMAATLFNARPVRATNGHVLHGIGTVNESLGGAGIATSIDGIGSNANNVSSIPFLDRNSIEFGAGVFVPNRSFSASITGAAAGSVDSRSREAVLPSFGLVYQLDNSWTFGFTGTGIAGMGVDYPSNLPNSTGHFNPLAVPQSFGGFGAISSNYQLLQLTPAVAYRIAPNLSVGLGANIDWSALSVDPFPAAPPNASGYPSASHTATAWGAGFTVGTTYKPLPNLALGLVFKSPQWFSSFHWNGAYPDGTPANVGFRLNYPLIVGTGVSYALSDPWLIAADVKWINYASTDGFDKKNFAATPQGPYVQGFGWKDIWTFSLGAQFKVTPAFALRAGYNYGENPIPSHQQFFNLAAPALVQHHLSGGVGISLTSNLDLNLAYYHGFQNEKSGPFISNGAAGYPPINQPIPGTRVTNTLSEDSVSAEVALRF